MHQVIKTLNFSDYPTEISNNLIRWQKATNSYYNINPATIDMDDELNDAEFDDLTNNSEITLCIIDNDKSHPAKGKGSTANLFKDFDKEYNNNSLTHIIDVREIESLLPIKVIEEVVCENKVPKDIESLDIIKAFKTVNISFREYFDHKEGLSL